MKGTTERAAARVEEAETFRKLKALIADGMADVEAGRVAQWNVDDFLRKVPATTSNWRPCR
jgi:predicted transcriptional regulator